MTDTGSGEKLEKRLEALEQELHDSQQKVAGLQRQVDLLNTIYNNTNSPIFLKKADFTYLFINQQFELLCGTTDEKIQGKNDFEVFPKPIADLFHDQDEEVILDPGSIDVVGQTYKLLGRDVETITASAGSGDNDQITMAGLEVDALILDSPPLIDRGRDAKLTAFGKATLSDRYLMDGESYQDLFARVAAHLPMMVRKDRPVAAAICDSFVITMSSRPLYVVSKAPGVVVWLSASVSPVR